MKTKKKTVAKATPKAPSVQVGAARALERLENEESRLFTEYQSAKKAGDPLETKLAHAAWLKTSEGLRKFDILIEAARREVGELVPRADVEKWLRNFGSCLHYALYRAVGDDLQKTWGLCDSAFTGFIQGYDPKRDAPFQDVPDWMHVALFTQRMGPGHSVDRFYFYKRRSLIVSALDQFIDDPKKAETWCRAEFAKLDAEKAAVLKTKGNK